MIKFIQKLLSSLYRVKRAKTLSEKSQSESKNKTEQNRESEVGEIILGILPKEEESQIHKRMNYQQQRRQKD